MQQILVDTARRKQRLKHGANQVGDELHESRIAASAPSEELLAVDDALATLTLEDPQAVLRFDRPLTTLPAYGPYVPP